MSNEDRNEVMHTYQAGILARYLMETLFRADSIKRYANKDASFHIEKADEEFKALAEHLGYTVKRDTQQEAA